VAGLYTLFILVEGQQQEAGTPQQQSTAEKKVIDLNGLTFY